MRDERDPKVSDLTARLGRPESGHACRLAARRKNAVRGTSSIRSAKRLRASPGARIPSHAPVKLGGSRPLLQLRKQTQKTLVTDWRSPQRG